MATPNQANPFSCTFKGCLGRFQTKGALKHHKVTRHDYCLVCDLDFEDDAAFLVHKVGSEKHITCPVCSEDFKSTDGRDRHIRQAHATEQNLRCVGCSEVFVRAGGLMDHFEKNRCTRIKLADFEKRRALKEMFMAQIANQAVERAGPRAAASEGGESGEDSGGVQLNVSSLLDSLEDDKAVNYPALDPSSSGPRSGTVLAATSFPTAWPELGISKDGASKADVRISNANVETSSITAGTTNTDASEAVKETDTKDEPTTTWGGSSSATLFPNAPKTPTTLDWTKSIKKPLGGLGAVDDPKIVLESTMDPNSPRFNPHQFRNAIGMFKCPYPKCGKSFPNPKAFAAHLQSPAHKGTDHRCPACLKIFKSPTALTQHMEAPTNRCNIKETANFGHAIHLVSGGYLTVEGKHADGTVKFETEEPQEPKW